MKNIYIVLHTFYFFLHRSYEFCLFPCMFFQ